MNPPSADGGSTGMDFAEVFTIAVRHVVPILRSRGLSFAFDCQSQGLQYQGDHVALQGCLHRLFMACISLLRGGSLLISAKAMDVDGRPIVFVHVAGAGLTASPSEIVAACQGLQLDLVHPRSATAGALTAEGLCPHTGGGVELNVVPREGALIRLALPNVAAGPEGDTSDHHARGAGAWLINVDDELARSWTRRLQRLGWVVSCFASYRAAMDQLREAPRGARPALVMVLETGDPSRDGALDLPPLFPGWSRMVYAVQTGSPTLRRPQDLHGYEVHVYPLSPHELEAITDEAAQPGWDSDTTVPMPLAAPETPMVLIVDDTALNLVIGQGFAEALGYKVQTARDGLEAIEACRHAPPDVVLMDMDMPRLNGIDAIRHLRLLQRQGDIPPFPITVVTAGWTPEVRDDCVDAGADACLEKPMSLEAMAQELGRVASYR